VFAGKKYPDKSILFSSADSTNLLGREREKWRGSLPITPPAKI
jgi:hypothetical protein